MSHHDDRIKTSDQVVGASFGDPAVQRCPFALYDALRKEAPVYRDPVTGNYVLTRYKDVRKAALTPKTLSNRTGIIATRESSVAEDVNRIYAKEGWLPLDTLVTNDLPEHRLYRSLVDKAFTTLKVEALESYIEGIVDELLANIIDKPEVEFLSEFAVQLPMRVIADQLNVSRADMGRFKYWSDCSVEGTSPVLSPDREIEITHVITEMQQYLARNIERVRREPNDSLLSALVHAEIDGRRLDVREILSILHQLLVAGNETTTSALAAGIKLMIEHPEIAPTLRREPERVRTFVEETLRVMSPVQALFRRAKEDIEIEGVHIPKGSIVELRYGAANRDPDTFVEPAMPDLCRANAGTHLAFGAGIHLCIGNQLARGEMRIAFRQIVNRMANIRASRGEESYAYTPVYISYGLTKLFIAFDRL